MRRIVSGTRTIAASRAQVFALLADPRKHPVIAGNHSVREQDIDAPDRLYQGAVFRTRMWFGIPYWINNEVVEYTENALIAWRNWGGHIWRWQLHEVAACCTDVEEVFDYRTTRSPRLFELIGAPRYNRRNIRISLENLDALARKQ
ncbi:hypothetical protein BS329_16945 [Amycolatopsis coloradensis]|uniref:Uncharacterized protein n=1 Tax=Amycolatopsis coloradensis TaxID=76021 RepID=A0A1R0KTW0_9PSEU|nr:SRPBCC family protein [Amycolatopsis coloradensis]OLZ51467.1 hypothetical protein BS329_16945 [Amycolatopsis coloradensis]